MHELSISRSEIGTSASGGDGATGPPHSKLDRLTNRNWDGADQLSRKVTGRRSRTRLGGLPNSSNFAPAAVMAHAAEASPLRIHGAISPPRPNCHSSRCTRDGSRPSADSTLAKETGRPSREEEDRLS